MTAICVRFVAAFAVVFSVFLLGATPAVGGTTERSVYYSYDAMGRQLSARFDSTSGADGITNVYDGFGDLTSSTISMSGFSAAVGSSYDQGGRRTAVVHPDGQTFTYAYDALDRLSGVYEGAGTATPLDTFSYGNNGLVSSRSEAGGSSVGYGYDDIGRLTSQSDAFVGGSGNVSRTFAFNPASGMTTETRDNDGYAFPTSQIGNVNRTYAVNGLNQYSSAGPASFTYDANGNLITDGTWVYTYDVENRLVHATGAGKDVTLTYDPLGRLYFVGGSNVGDVHFVYDGDALIEEYASTGAMTNRYVHGSNAAADDPLVWYSGSAVGSGNRQWLHADHLGSIVARTNGGAPSINSYDEYGIPATNNAGRFGYTGQAWLYEIGLDYYKARMYSPTLGRFLQTDPIGYKDQVNLYAYAGDDPIDHGDPTGETVTVLGPQGDRDVLKSAILAVGRTSPQLRARLLVLIHSRYQHTVSFGTPNCLPSQCVASNTPRVRFGAEHGMGSPSDTVVSPSYKTGVDSLSRDLKTMIAHELFGHAFNSDVGRTQSEFRKDPVNGVPYEEESAMQAENNFNHATGRPTQNTYENKPLPEWSIDAGRITGSRMQGTRICPKDGDGSTQNSC